MKKIILFITVVLFSLQCYSQNAYYDALKISKFIKGKSISVDNNESEATKELRKEKDSLFNIGKPADSTKKRGEYLVDSLIPKSISKTRDTLNSIFEIYFRDSITSKKADSLLKANPFFSDLGIGNLLKGNTLPLSGISPNSPSSIGGIDVTNIVNGVADLMIERAKEELTITFFDRFKKFAENNPEFQILFPKTTDNLNNLLSYTYPQMLPILRSGFLADLQQLTYHLPTALELPRYQQLLAKFPEVRVAIKSLQLIHNLEDSTSNAAGIIDSFASFPEWKETSGSAVFKNAGSLVKLSAIISNSLRAKTDNPDSSIWVSGKEIKGLVTDTVLAKIYMGLVYQQIKDSALTFNNVNVADIFAKQKSNILFFQSKIQEFISLTDKVSTTLASIKAKSKKDISNDDYYNYINVSLDAVDYAFSLVKNFDQNFKSNNYLDIARKANDLYKAVYSQQYTQAISDGIDIFQDVDDVVSNNSDTSGEKNTLCTMLTFIQKVKPYAFLIANIAEAKSSDDVKAALENAILPVGSSSIKKNSIFNISIQSYLGCYYTFHNSSSSVNAWSDKFGVTAPIGISFNWGLNKGPNKNAGSVSAFLSLFDLGAIVDYKLTKEPVVSNTNTTDSVISKDYSVKLGQIFSPGLYFVYGFFGNVPLSIGIGAQYGPGLAKINTTDVGASTEVVNPSIRCNVFLAVDLPFFTLKNKTNYNH
jgi:hypothetical protein